MSEVDKLDIKMPLVSIIVITYNSESYVIETLDSVKNQTYKNIEIIITDDCSKDNTVKICQEWIENNKAHFVNHNLILTEKNSGVAANCNRGLKASTGAWIKIIAGDDLLMTDCIIKNINFSKENLDFKIFISNMVMFEDQSNPRKILKTVRPKNEEFYTKEISAKQQYAQTLIEYFGVTPTFFIKKSVYHTIIYDEKFKFLEDYPFALNALKAGFKILYNDTNTVYYRVRTDSISNLGGNDVLHSTFFFKIRNFNEVYRLPFLDKMTKTIENNTFKRQSILVKYNLNHNNFVCKIIERIIYQLINYRVI